MTAKSAVILQVKRHIPQAADVACAGLPSWLRCPRKAAFSLRPGRRHEADRENVCGILAAFAGALDGGKGADTLDGGTGNDTYIVSDAGDVVVEAANAGTDLVQSSVSWRMAANVEKLTLTGTANLNAVGNSLKKIITGNTGHNVLNGGGGIDSLTGGSGADAFVFNTAPGSTNIDTITDFRVIDDTIRIDNAVFTAAGADGALSAAAFRIGAAAGDANDRIIYKSSTGALLYDSNGAATGGAVQFAKLHTGLSLTSADFLII